MTLLQDLVVREDLGLRPWIQIVQAQENRNEQEEHQRESHEAGFEKPPGRIAPTSTGQLMDHGHHETSQGEAEPKQATEQVGEEELLSIDKAPMAVRARKIRPTISATS